MCNPGLVEYTFGKSWMLSKLCPVCLKLYKQSKFRVWRTVETVDDIMTLERWLQAGLITQMNDHNAFPSPANEVNQWKVCFFFFDFLIALSWSEVERSIA